MMVPSHLMWLVHVLPAVALTITAPAQTTPSLAPLSGCGSENLIKDVAFESIDLDDSVWTVLPPNGGAAVDGYLHLSAEALQSQTLLTQTVTGTIAEESYTVSFDLRQTAGSGVDGATCAVNLLLNGADVGTSTLTAGSWETISKQWTAVSSEVDMFILIDCPNAAISGATVDVTNVSFEKSCGSSTSTSVSVSIKTPSGSPVATSAPLASSSISPSGHSSSEGSGYSSHVSSVSPSSTVGRITLTTTITGPAKPASTSAIESSASTPEAPAPSESTVLTAPASVEPTNSSPAGTPAPDMTTSTIFTTRTATITACPSTVTNCPATDKTTHITTETIVISTTVCPVEDATTTAEGSSPTGPSGNGNGHNSGNGNDYTISTILSTRTVTLTQCPATVTDCPARDQTTHIMTEIVVAGTTSVPINTAGTTTVPGAVHTSSVPVQTTAVVVGTETNTSTAYSVITATGTTTTDGGVVGETGVSRVGGNVPGSGVSAGEGEGEGDGSTSSSSSPSVFAGNNASHISNLPNITRTRISSATPSSFIGIHSATAKVSSVTASSTTGTGAGTSTGTGSGSTTEGSNSASASPVFNGASSSTVSGILSALGAITALALFL
ncbi:hypothetical protein N7536_005475 [Penicillium majusculum]|uniref:CBM-cenC domain-containing protein n=1 Tax=Penicillium solitum TaxID=60172 RepID=A0A1V6RP92_9EURO|nr:uncharacterized protein PENSOL_c001G09616 [Penicillium solitum]KAJ5695063.1 hypothetical protein N7536_005475 [Penicillium majusculum]OQE03612.1 hypothetical protein PENSOL_c001G09616 [Penicillium solitum]